MHDQVRGGRYADAAFGAVQQWRIASLEIESDIRELARVVAADGAGSENATAVMRSLTAKLSHAGGEVAARLGIAEPR